MKLGFPLRRAWTRTLEAFRNMADMGSYIFWFLFDPSKFTKIKTEKIKNLLVIYGGSIGDVYNAIGLMNASLEKYPSLNIYFLTYEKNKKYVKNPRINLVSLDQTRKLIVSGKFDAVILLQGILVKQELFSKKMYLEILKIPYRVTCDNMHLGLILRQIPPLVTRRVFSVDSNGFKDQLISFNLLGFNIKGPKFYYTKESEEFAEDFIKKNKISKKEKIIFMHIGGGSIVAALREGGTGDPTHMWPLERWAISADKLIEKFNARVLFTGVGKEENALVEKVISLMKYKDKAISLVGKTNIEQSASLFKRGDLLITIDTGTMHIAAQTGIPIIGMFSSFKPRSTSSLAKQKIDLFHPEVCTGCRKYTFCPEGNNVCMKSISVQEVLNSADKFLN